MTRVLPVPGRNEPLPEHWQEWLRGRDPERRWVRHARRGRYVAEDRLALPMLEAPTKKGMSCPRML
ncbi:hypothetical protein [Micromonospora sp. RTGN7]|uniref:hypothetical protein n=1 Tax=Micromonospora sp. RTGN7 TaxID=3016526 RepID=UPI0029FF0A5E|nr:hypothetical protein [Micromonospora sp. RTGN7]